MAYVSVTDVRALTNIVEADLTNDEINALIAFATSQVNSDLNIRVTRERVLLVDNTRKNEINGTNTTYYIKNWEGNWIADANSDGTIDENDITVYLVATDNTETTATVSSVTSSEGKYVLATAPTTATASKMYVTYEYVSIDTDTPDPKIVLATAILVAALGYEKINRGMSPQQVYGNVRFMRDMKAGNEYFKRYQEEMSKINADMMDWEESETF